METIKNSEASLKETLEQLRGLARQSIVFVDEIPEILQEDFNDFLIGKTLSLVDGRSVTYDLEQYIDKIVNKSGTKYPIQWKL